MNPSRPPALGRLLLRALRLGDRRAEVEADLLELFDERADSRGLPYARRRYYGDVLSLWRRRGAPAAPSAIAGARPHVGREAAQDLRYALRLLRRSPAVVAVTVLGLGLAIGVGTAVFSLLNAMAFRSTGITEPSTAARVLRAYQDGIGTSWRYSDFVQLRDATHGASLDAWLRDEAAVGLTADADAFRTMGVTFVTGGYLGHMNSRSARGRLLLPSDDAAGAAPVAVVSHAFWQRTLAADPAIVGRTLWLNGVAFTIVGVSARGFSGMHDSTPTIWAPVGRYHLVTGGTPVDGNTALPVNVVARLDRNSSLAQSQAELGAVAAALPAASVDHESAPLTGVRLVATTGPLARSEVSGIVTVTAIVFTVIALVVLLACVNVTNLLLAAAVARQREFGVRLALGASRWRIVRQLMTESVLFGIAGGASGLLITVWLVPALARVAGAPVSIDLTPDLRVYLFLSALSIIAGVGAGLVPARHAMRDSFASPLKGSLASDTAFSRSVSSRALLVGVQAAVSLVLLVGAALLARGMVRATQIDVGFDANRLMTVSPGFARGDDAARAQAYWDVALERVRTLPGVRSASLAESPPFGGSSRVTVFRRSSGRYTITHNDTRSEFFAVVGLRAVRGRTYTAAEVADRAPVAVISETLARDFFGPDDPIGQPLSRIIDDSKATIIGVVSNAITARLRDLGSATIYQPMNQTVGAKMLVRTAGPPEALVQSVRTALQPLNPRARLNIGFVADGLQRQIAEPRALAAVAGILAIVALALAVVGLYGVTAFIVGQRTQEIGLRMALGANGRDVMRLLLGDSLRPVVIGLAAGIVLALVGGRAFAGVLYGVPSADPIAFVAAIALLTIAALAAVIWPTRRASSVDPAAVLRRL